MDMSDGKPCRACTDFKTWAKMQKETMDSEKEKKKDKRKPIGNPYSTSTRTDCPLDKNELGAKTWAFLHTMAAYYPDKPTTQQKNEMKSFLHIFSRFYPCSSCAEDLRDQLKISPPETDSQSQLSQWLCQIHNEVNRKLGKPEFNCKLVNQRWRDGWADGSCD